jgi:hypothetical protein
VDELAVAAAHLWRDPLRKITRAAFRHARSPIPFSAHRLMMSRWINNSREWRRQVALLRNIR